MTDLAAVLALPVRRRNGDPTPLERLRRKSHIDPGGCWTWNGTLNNNGYGCIGVNGQVALVHRLAHHLLIGPIPDGLQVDHVCHNEAVGCPSGRACTHRRCWRPDHLEAVPGLVNRRRALAAKRRDCQNGLHVLHAYAANGNELWRICVNCHLPAHLWSPPTERTA